MTKQQLRERKKQVDKQASILKMMYDKVDVVDYKLGLIRCTKNNSALMKLYKENEELFSDLNIGYISNNKYFIVLRIDEKCTENQPSFTIKIKYTILLNKRTLEEIFRFEGALTFSEVICNGKYIIVESLFQNNIYLFDVNNNKLVFSATNGMTGLLEKVINQLGKGVLK